MPNNFENFVSVVKQVTKKFTRAILLHALPIILIILLILIITSGLVYELTKQDASYREDDWTSTPYASEQYTGNVTINEDGTITTEMTAQEVWDEMTKRGSRVEQYLRSPEELLKFMNAELITNYPDTRPNPDDPIDWETLNKDINSKNVQGIIKFDRARDNGTVQRLSYVNPATFYGWIEEYLNTGSTSAKENALTHFTINSNSTVTYEFDEADLTTDISKAIVQSAYSTPTTEAGKCQGWVSDVYQNAGLTAPRYYSAYVAYEKTLVSTDMNNIPVGAAVYGTGVNTNGCGHVGIYIGNGMVRDSIGYVREVTLERWISGQTDTINGKTGWLGWGWQVELPDTDANDEENASEGELTNTTDGEDIINQPIVSDIDNSYSVIVATWKEVETIVTSNDPAVAETHETDYYMTTEAINYQEFVSGYTMPFDFLWALTVTGRDKDFTLEVADLVFDSEIIITIHDNLTITTDVTTEHYTKTVNEHPEHFYKRTTVITRDNTLDIALTKADVWCVDYSQSFVNTIPQKIEENSSSGSGSNRTEYSHTVTSNKYVSSPPVEIEKLDPLSNEPNFATILNKREYYQARNNIMSAPDWLFEILETMDSSTVDLLDLTKYVLYKSTNKDFGVTDYEFSTFDHENFQDITSGGNTSSGTPGSSGTSEEEGENGGTPESPEGNTGNSGGNVDASGRSLYTPSLTKEEFISCMQAYYNKTKNSDFYNNFLQHAEEIYDVSVENNINPELVVVTARQEGTFAEAGGRYNYWGLNASNYSSGGSDYNSLEEGIEAFSRIIHSYEEGSFRNTIMERYQERKDSGCDPLGYGLPGTLSGMQMLFSWVGKHVEGNPRDGGYYVMDPGVKGITAVYSTHEEFLEKCKESGLPEHAYGAPPTPWEEGQYTAYQVRQKLSYWNEMFTV